MFWLDDTGRDGSGDPDMPSPQRLEHPEAAPARPEGTGSHYQRFEPPVSLTVGMGARHPARQKVPALSADCVVSPPARVAREPRANDPVARARATCTAERRST